MARNRNRVRKKRYPGKGRRLPLIPVDIMHTSKPLTIIKSSRRRWDVESDSGSVSSGSRIGYRPVLYGDGYSSGVYEGTDRECEVWASRDNCETFEIIDSEVSWSFTLPYGKPDYMEHEPWGIIRDEDGQVLFEGKAEHAVGYAKGIMQIIRELGQDYKSPWTRRAFIVNRKENGKYFYKGETHKKNDDGKWKAVKLGKGDVVVRPGDKAWQIKSFEYMTKVERERPIIAGKVGEAAEKVQGSGYDNKLAFEDSSLMSADFAARFDS